MSNTSDTLVLICPECEADMVLMQNHTCFLCLKCKKTLPALKRKAAGVGNG